MANAIVTFKIMPESPETDLETIKEQAMKIATEAGAKGDLQSQIEPLAFGLKALKVLAMYEVKDDLNTDAVAEKMQELEGVQTAEVASFDLAMG